MSAAPRGGQAAARHRHRPALGIAFVCAAIALMSGQDAILKWLTAGYATMQILAVRGALVLVLTAIVLHRDGGLATLVASNLRGHLLRGVLNLVAIATFIAAVERLPLATVMAVTMVAPLLTLALSALALGEHVGPRRWLACLIGFAGVLIMLNPAGGAFNAGGAAALAASLSYSCLIIQTRRLTRTERTGPLLFVPALVIAVVAGAVAPFGWRPLAGIDLALMLGAGACVTVGHYWFVQAYRFASPAVLAPFDYTALVWGALLGWLVWRDVPGAEVIIGGALVVGAGAYVLYRETRPARGGDVA